MSMKKDFLIFGFVLTIIVVLQLALAQTPFCAKDPTTDQWKCWGTGYKCYDYWSPVVCGGNQINFSGTLNYSDESGLKPPIQYAELLATIDYSGEEYSGKTLTDEDGYFFVKVDVPSYLQDADFYVTFYLKKDIEAFYTCHYNHTSEICS